MKKLLSLTLSLVMIMTTLCALPFSAKADVNYSFKYYFKEDAVLGTGATIAKDVSNNLSDFHATWYRGYYSLPEGSTAEPGNFGYRLYLQGEIRNFDRNDDYKVSFNGVALEKNQYITGSYVGDGYYYEEISTKIAEITIQVTFYPLRCSSSDNLTYGGEGYHIENEKVRIYTDVKKYKDMHIADWYAQYYDGSNAQEITIPAEWITTSEDYGTELNLPMPAAPTDVLLTVGDCVYEEKVIKEATETEEGRKAQVCKVCGAIKDGTEEKIDKLPPSEKPADNSEEEAKKKAEEEAKKKAEEEAKKKAEEEAKKKAEEEAKKAAFLAAQPTLKLKAGKKKLTASWTAVEGAEFYEIQYATNKKFKKAKTKKVAAAKVKAAIKKLKKGKKYFVRVRAIKGGDVSAWSKTKKVKVK